MQVLVHPFFVTFLFASLVTVAPSGETLWGIMLILLILSILSGIAAASLSKKYKSNPEAHIFKSRVVSRIGIGIAISLTLFLLFGVIA